MLTGKQASSAHLFGIQPKVKSSCVTFVKCLTAPMAMLTTLNHQPYEYELLSFVLGMWEFNKPVEFNYVISILLNVR